MTLDNASRPNSVIDMLISSRGRLTEDIVERINNACDSAEDIGERALIRIHLDDQTGISRTDTHAKPETSLVNKWERALRRLERLPNVCICTVKGECSSINLSILLTTDFRVAADDVVFSALDADDEVFPCTLIYRLANEVGRGRSRRMVLFGAELDADMALNSGIIDEKSNHLNDVVNAFMEKIVDVDIGSLSTRRQLLLEASEISFDNALGAHLAAYDRANRRHS